MPKGRIEGKLVLGVGVSDVEYLMTRSEKQPDGTYKVVWSCPFAAKWKGLLNRCYSKFVLKKRPTYTDCFVCDDWLYLSKFKAWMEQQDWEGKELDKDILFPGNKLYSPETCVFVERRVNLFITESPASRGDWPIGVSWCKRSSKFVAQSYSALTGKHKFIGYYKDPETAHSAWLAYKLEQAYILAEQQTDERVAKALIERYENYV